jgi:hypothetical protein
VTMGSVFIEEDPGRPRGGRWRSDGDGDLGKAKGVEERERKRKENGKREG